MCGRYYIDEETAKELEKIVKKLDQKLKQSKLRRDIHPTEQAPILIRKDGHLKLVEARWGFTSAYQKGPIFNARIETIDTKPMFQERLTYGRCLVPAAGFYEWSKEKEKYQFSLKNKPFMLMGGLYRMEGMEEHFTIITKPSVGSIEMIHERMPIIFQDPAWLCEDLDLEKTKKQEIFLEKYIENEQLKFEF